MSFKQRFNTTGTKSDSIIAHKIHVYIRTYTDLHHIQSYRWKMFQQQCSTLNEKIINKVIEIGRTADNDDQLNELHIKIYVYK